MFRPMSLSTTLPQLRASSWCGFSGGTLDLLSIQRSGLATKSGKDLWKGFKFTGVEAEVKVKVSGRVG